MSRTLTALCLMIALAAVALLAGCNTVRGVGQDMQGIGNYIAGSAEERNPYGP